MTVGNSLRVFVGASLAEWLPVRVLEYSARLKATKQVHFQPMFDLTVPTPKHRKNQPGTNFSLYRFAIPRLCKYDGIALYLDSDMIVFRDIAELCSIPFDGASVLVTKIGDPDYFDKAVSVMLLDCSKLTWKVEEIVDRMDQGRFTYDQLMLNLSVISGDKVAPAIPPHWNSLDKYESGKTALLHYTNMHTQPWITRDSPLGSQWLSFLIQATQDGFVTLQDIERQVTAGHVRPSLLPQVREAIIDSSKLPDQYRHLDADFVPPFKRLQKSKILDRAYRRARREFRKLKAAFGLGD